MLTGEYCTEKPLHPGEAFLMHEPMQGAVSVLFKAIDDMGI
jgi:hypothetical protein